jgi:Amt family ammonium transporter
MSETTSSIYEQCYNNETTNQLQCIADLLEAGQKNNKTDIHNWFLIYSASLIFFMQCGFAMVCAGNVQKKNVSNSMLKNLLDACGSALGFFSVGFAFAFGGQSDSTRKTFIGTKNFFMIGLEEEYAFWMFQFGG